MPEAARNRLCFPVGVEGGVKDQGEGDTVLYKAGTLQVYLSKRSEVDEEKRPAGKEAGSQSGRMQKAMRMASQLMANRGLY